MLSYKYFLFPSVSAPYRDCAELLNAGIRKAGVHSIRDKNWILPVYSDQEVPVEVGPELSMLTFSNQSTNRV